MAERNWANRTLWTADNLDIMRGMNSQSVDLIYLDPPFNSNSDYQAPLGTPAEGAEFKDTWTLDDLDVAWVGLIAEEEPPIARLIDTAGTTHSKDMQSYLTMMAVRLLEMRRLLTPNGSIYLHCDPTASHYLKALMDAIFGRTNFRNEITWYYYNKLAPGKRVFGRSFDQLLFYAFGDYTFHPQREPRDAPVRQLVRESVDGVLKNKRDADGNLIYRTVDDKKVDAVWRIPGIQPAAKDYIGFPTQKHVRLLERVISASSNPGDMLLDPFCGCATALVAAESLDREWVGIDISPKAAELVNVRLQQTMGGLFHNRLVTNRTDNLKRTDIDAPKNYRQHKHVLYGEQEGRCNGCRTAFEFRHLEVDHVVPKSRGGSDHISNLQLLCGSCNRIKGDRSQAYLLAELRKRNTLDDGPF